jgi:outer membrane biosynthesis protein TonB
MSDFEQSARREPILGIAPAIPDHADPRRRDEASWRDRLVGPAGSFGLHVIVLLAILLGWRMPAPVEHPPIPVRIVFLPPPKPKPPPRRALAKPPPSHPHKGRIASENFGDTNPKDLGPVNRDGLTTGGALLQLAVPKPSLPALPKSPSAEFAAVPRPPPKPRPARHMSQPRRMTTRLAKYPGTDATKSEYLAYLAALTRQHLDLLPTSLVGRRRGVTVIGVVERSDGTIARLSVLKSSGYPDIDERVERMIAAVGRFPPIPQWY